MLGSIRRGAVAALALVVGWLGAAAAAEAAPALWRVSGGHAQIYLFGTLHALDPATAARWRTPAYDAAYQAAGTVWFEADLGAATPQAMREIMARYGVDPARTLSQKLAPADLAQLRRQVDLARVDHLRPWAAALMLSMQPMLTQGASVQAGADSVMTRQARVGDKTIRTFETLQDQARLFASLSEPAEVAYLSEVIRERAPRPRLIRAVHAPRGDGGDLEREWLDGDLARLGPELVGALKAENPAFYEVLLKRRNLAWADTLTHELQTASGVELVNVGALHMVGDDGLPALLKARGFTVERVQ